MICGTREAVEDAKRSRSVRPVLRSTHMKEENAKDADIQPELPCLYGKVRR